MFKATWKQKQLYWILPILRWLIIRLKILHNKLANYGIEQHPCWAGGLVDGAITAQPCSACETFYDEADWEVAPIYKLKLELLKKKVKP